MSYVETNLIMGEKVLYKTGLHWIAVVLPYVLGGFFGLIGIMSLIGGLVAGAAGTVVVGFILIAASVGGIWLAVLTLKATEVAVTNKRVVIKVGLLRRRTFELLLSKVESIGVDEGVMGRMLGYGSVIVRGTGGTPEPFRRIMHPTEFRRQVQQQVETSEQNKLPGQNPPSRQPLQPTH
jgi:uncharacterized membrane protein YdbT with pleckstrin-like domain